MSLLLSSFSSLLSLWNHIPAQFRVLIVAVVLKVIVDGARALKPRIDGRAVHALVFILGFAGMVIDQAVNAGITSPYATMIADAVQASLLALGVNEVTKPRLAPAPTDTADKNDGPSTN